MPDLPNGKSSTTDNQKTTWNNSKKTQKTKTQRKQKNPKQNKILSMKVNIPGIWKWRGGIFSASIRYWNINWWLVATRKICKTFDSQNLMFFRATIFRKMWGFRQKKMLLFHLKLSFLNNNKEKKYFYFLSKFCTYTWQLRIPVSQAILKYRISTVLRLTVIEHWDNTAFTSEGLLNSVLDRKKSLTNIVFEKVHVCWSSICAIRNPASKKGIWCLCRRWKGAFFFPSFFFCLFSHRLGHLLLDYLVLEENCFFPLFLSPFHRTKNKA